MIILYTIYCTSLYKIEIVFLTNHCSIKCHVIYMYIYIYAGWGWVLQMKLKDLELLPQLWEQHSPYVSTRAHTHIHTHTHIHIMSCASRTCTYTHVIVVTLTVALVYICIQVLRFFPEKKTSGLEQHCQQHRHSGVFHKRSLFNSSYMTCINLMRGQVSAPQFTIKFC